MVVSYPSERDRFFERILGWPVGDGTCWVSIGGDSWFLLEGLGNVSLTVCEASLRLEQIMEAPSNEDVRSFVESAREEALVERRRS